MSGDHHSFYIVNYCNKKKIMVSAKSFTVGKNSVQEIESKAYRYIYNYEYQNYYLRSDRLKK